RHGSEPSPATSVSARRRRGEATGGPDSPPQAPGPGSTICRRPGAARSRRGKDFPMTISRRDVLKLGGTAVAVGAARGLLAPGAVAAQAPKRGGVFRIAGFEPQGFDPQQTLSYRSLTILSMTHSRLVRVKTGPAVRPGTTPLEPDLAESWSQPGDTTYVFRLRRGVRW